MTKEEIMTRLDKIERELFYIDMIDRWTKRDEERHNSLIREKWELKDKLKEM